MKPTFSAILSRVTFLSLIFSLAGSVNAVPAPTVGKVEKPATTTAPTETNKKVKLGKKRIAAAAAVAGASSVNESGKLDEAYGLLSRADHDYDGHRMRAMHQIEDAARVMGQKLGGEGKGKEKQATSDEQLHSALSLLQGAVGGLVGKPHHHIVEAIKHLNIALKIK